METKTIDIGQRLNELLLHRQKLQLEIAGVEARISELTSLLSQNRQEETDNDQTNKGSD